MTNTLLLINNAASKVINLTQRIKSKINLRRTVKKNNSVIRNNLVTQNNNELNKNITFFVKKVNQLIERINQIIKNTKINKVTILEPTEQIIQIVNEIDILLKVSTKNKYFKIRNNIEKIRNYIIDVVNKSELISDNDIEIFSEEIEIDIDMLYKLILETSKSINKNIEYFKESIDEKRKVIKLLENQLNQNLSRVNKPFVGFLRKNAQKKYNLTQSSMKNMTLRNINSLNKEIAYLQKQLNIARNIKNRK